MNSAGANGSSSDTDKQARAAALVNWPVLYDQMDRQRLDAVVVASPENHYYLSGCFVECNRHIRDRDRVAFVVVPRHGESTFVLCSIEAATAKALGWIEDIRTYAHYADSAASLVDALEDLGLSNGRIGIEEQFCTTAFYERINSALSGATLVGADSAVEHARARKMPGEIELLKELAEISLDSAHAAWTTCHAGMSEHDVAIATTLAMLQHGAERVDHVFVGTGVNTCVLQMRPGETRLEQGKLVLSDFGALHNGNWADLSRMGVVGEPSSRQRELYRLLRDVQRAVVARMRPGARCNDLYVYARDAFMSAGVTDVLPQIGHSMSRAPGHERPILNPLDGTPLEANMLFAVGPSFRLGTERYELKDLVLVTDSEAVVLSDGWDTEDLFVFPTARGAKVV